MSDNLSDIAKSLVAPKKGILAADESVSTMTKRLESVNVESTQTNRSLWREIMSTADGIESAISGVILYDETISNPLPGGQNISEILKSKNIHPGIKVDEGTVKFNPDGETFTIGLDKLEERLGRYREMGATFTKWRAVYKIGNGTPGEAAITANSIGLAEYAVLVQKAGLVPIVEPEVLVLEGDHDIEKSREVTLKVLKDVFFWLDKFGVQLDGILLKPNMVLPGKKSSTQSDSSEISRLTVETLKEAVPTQVPGIVFLSGGLTPDQSTDYLKTMNSQYGDLPWQLSYSFGRALQQEGLQAWSGISGNIKSAQEKFMERAGKVSVARG